MDIVTDASAILAIVLNEPDKPTLVQQTQGAILYAPCSLPWEIGNALSALLKCRRIDVVQAAEAIEQYDKIPLTLVDVDLLQAVTLAHRLNIYAYD